MLVVGWLASELLGSVSIRRALAEDRSTIGSVTGALRWTARHPIRAVEVLGATVFAGALLIAPALVASGAAWSAARSALLGGASPLLTALAVGVFVAVWAGALALAGLVAAWRSAAWSLAVMGDHRVGGLVPGSGGTL